MKFAFFFSSLRVRVQPERGRMRWLVLRIAQAAICVLSLQIASAQSGNYKDRHDFGGTVTNTFGQPVPDGLNPPSGVTFDDQGNMFGTTMTGGQNGRGNVWEITAAGVYKDLHDFGGKIITSIETYGLDGSSPYSGVTVDKNGNLYGTTFSGGAYGAFPGDGIVWEITTEGVYKDLHDFGGIVTYANGADGPDGTGPLAGVAFDSAGNLYGTTQAGGAIDLSQGGGGIVWEITIAGEYKDLHDFGGTVINANGKQGPDGTGPAGVMFDKVGNMVGTTTTGGPNGAGRNAGIVWEITAAGKYKDLHDFGGTVTNADGKRGPDGQIPFGGVTFDSTGNLYGTAAFGGANPMGGIVWEISAAGLYKDLHDFGGTGTNAGGKSGRDGYQPWAGVTFDGTGNMYGTTNYGGPNIGLNVTAGIVWEITSAHVYKDLHDFGADVTNTDGTSGPDGYEPYYARVTFDSSGNMFGTTQYGGPYGGGAGLLWEITAPGVASVGLNPNTVEGGTSSTGTVTLTGPAPSGGALVKLSSTSTSATVPESVTVKSGMTTATFPVKTVAVASNVTAIIKAAYGSSSGTANLAIDAPTLKSLTLSPTSVKGGKSSMATVTLLSAAPPGGLTISLSSSNSSATVPVSVKVAAGAKSATFTVKTTAVIATTTTTIMATTNGTSIKASLTITK